MRRTYFVFVSRLLAGTLFLLLLLTTGCAERSTEPRTTEQSDGHGPGCAARLRFRHEPGPQSRDHYPGIGGFGQKEQRAAALTSAF
jgi:hypothetical protein